VVGQDADVIFLEKGGDEEKSICWKKSVQVHASTTTYYAKGDKSMEKSSGGTIYEVDHTVLDILVDVNHVDRVDPLQGQMEHWLVRPRLIAFVDPSSRLVKAVKVSHEETELEGKD